MPGQKTRVDNGPVRVEYDVEDLGSNGNLRHGRIEEELAIIRRSSIRNFLFEVICVVRHGVNKVECNSPAVPQESLSTVSGVSGVLVPQLFLYRCG